MMRPIRPGQHRVVIWREWILPSGLPWRPRGHETAPAERIRRTAQVRWNVNCLSCFELLDRCSTEFEAQQVRTAHLQEIHRAV